MTEPKTLEDRCRAAVAAASAEHGWDLSPDAQQRYVAGLLPHLEAQMPDLKIALAVGYYHAEHALLQALSDAADPTHNERWEAWVAQIVKIIGHERLQSPGDPIIAFEDLVQIASGALARSLNSYHYQSRFSTWAYGVAVRSAQRAIRDLGAAKRAGRPISLDQDDTIDAPLDDDAHPEAIVATRALRERIEAILSGTGDDRLRQIVRYHIFADQHIDDIGARLQVHPSRVRVLFQQAKALLRDHPELRGWFHEGEAPEDTRRAEAKYVKKWYK